MRKIAIMFLAAVFVSFAVTGVFARGQSDDISYRTKLADMSWDKIVELAKEEGEVSWFVWYRIPQYREIAKDFENRYGIKVTIPEGDNSGNMNKLIAEKGLTVGKIDVLAHGSDSVVKLEDSLYGSITDIIPDIENRITNYLGHDSYGYGLGFHGNQTGIGYDSKKISKSELPQTFEEVQQFIRENPKEFGFNIQNGGSGRYFLSSAIRHFTGESLLSGEDDYKEGKDLSNWAPFWEWLENDKDNYVITTSNADGLTRLSDGEFILVPTWLDLMLSLQKQGAIRKDIKFYIPEFGMPGGGNFSSIAKNAPHPAAALVFLEWLTSAETQTLISQELGAVPANKESDKSGDLSFLEEQEKYRTPAASRNYILILTELLSEKL